MNAPYKCSRYHLGGPTALPTVNTAPKTLLIGAVFTVGGGVFTLGGGVFTVGGGVFTIGGAVFTVGGATQKCYGPHGPKI